MNEINEKLLRMKQNLQKFIKANAYSSFISRTIHRIIFPKRNRCNIVTPPVYITRLVPPPPVVMAWWTRTELHGHFIMH